MKSYQNSPPHAPSVDDDSLTEVKGHYRRRYLCLALKFVVGLSVICHILAVSYLAVGSSGSSSTRATNLRSSMLETNILAASSPSYIRRDKERRPKSKQKHPTKSERNDGVQKHNPNDEKTNLQNHPENVTVKSNQSRSGSMKQSSGDNKSHDSQSSSDDSIPTSEGGKHHHHKHVDVHVVVDDDDYSPQHNQKAPNHNSANSSSNMYEYNTGFDWQKCVHSKDPDCWNNNTLTTGSHAAYEPTEPPTHFDWKQYATKLKSDLSRCMHSNDPDCWKKVFAEDEEVSSPSPSIYDGTSPPTFTPVAPTTTT